MLTVACFLWHSKVPGHEVLVMLDLWDVTAALAVVGIAFHGVHD